MTALRIHHDDPRPTPNPPTPAPSPARGVVRDGARWYTLDDAARIIGIDRANLNRRLNSKGWERQGMARLMTRSGIIGDGREVWHVRADADPALLRAHVGAEGGEGDGGAGGAGGVGGVGASPSALTRATKKQRESAIARARILVAFRAWSIEPGVAVRRDFASFRHRAASLGLVESADACPALRSIQLWDERAPARDLHHAAASLLDSRGRPRGDESYSPEAWSKFLALYLSPDRWGVAKCWRIVDSEARAKGWAWVSKRRAHELVRDRIDEGSKILARQGLEAWRKRCSVPIEQDPNAWAPGECWEGDSTTLDLFARVTRGEGWSAIRPQLTAWLDRRTRRVMGWAIVEQGSSASIRSSLIMGLRGAVAGGDASRPRVVWIDNGKDFASKAIGGLTKAQRRSGDHEREATGLLGMLGIEAHFSIAYNPNGKARVERFFGTAKQEWCSDFPTYTGTGADQVRGMLDRRRHRALVEDVMGLPTIDEVRDRFAAFVAWYNARADHGIDDLIDPATRERLSPDEFYRRHLPEREALVDPDALTLLEEEWGERKVSKRGVSVRLGGRSVVYWAPQLEAHLGRTVRVSVDLNDTTAVRVWDLDYRFLCVAAEAERGGGVSPVTVGDRKRAHNRKRDAERRARARVDLADLALTPGELAAREARAREVAQERDRLTRSGALGGGDDAPSVRLVRTPVDDRASDVERHELRQAAGAECFAPIDDDDLDLSEADPIRFAGDDDEGIDLGELESASRDDADDAAGLSLSRIAGVDDDPPFDYFEEISQ